MRSVPPRGVRHTSGSSDQVRFLICTAKRLCNLAQGCRAARLPWVKESNDPQPQRGCVGFEDRGQANQGD